MIHALGRLNALIIFGKIHFLLISGYVPQFLTPGSKQCFSLTKAAIDILRSQCLEVKTTESLAEHPKPAKKAKRESLAGGFWDFINDKTNQAVKSDSSHDSEIHACVSSNADPLKYWKCHEE